MGKDKQKKVLLTLICFQMCVSMMQALKSANEKEEEEDLPECRPHKDSTTLRVQVAAHGYDIWKSDPFAEVSGDPGQKDRIFEVQCIDQNTSLGGYYDFFSAYPDYSCRKTFNARTFKTFKDYLSTISSTTEYSNSFSAEASGGAFGVSLSASAKYKKSGDSELAKTRRLFEKKNGEIRVATAVCKTYDARINTNWLRPKFSRNFIAALERLQGTLTESDSKKQATMKRFIDSFGTHIMTEVDFGAKMLYEKRFTSKSTNTEASSKRGECVKESVSGCIGGGYKGVIVKVKAKACAGSKEGRCTDDEFDNSYGEKNSLSSTKLRTIGSPLSSDVDWGKGDSFHPVPIRRKLELISSLFTSTNLKKSKFYGFSKSLDHQGLTKLFNDIARQYCTLVLGKSTKECTEELSGCGLNDNCEYGQRCRNDKTKPHGYFCSSSGCVAQASGGNCNKIGGECWCFHDVGSAIAVCGHPSGYSGKYYSLARSSTNLPWAIIKSVGKSPRPSYCDSNTAKGCDGSSFTNLCLSSGCSGTDLTLSSDELRWKSDRSGIVRCTNLEG